MNKPLSTIKVRVSSHSS